MTYSQLPTLHHRQRSRLYRSRRESFFHEPSESGMTSQKTSSLGVPFSSSELSRDWQQHFFSFFFLPVLSRIWKADNVQPVEPWLQTPWRRRLTLIFIKSGSNSGNIQKLRNQWPILGTLIEKYFCYFLKLQIQTWLIDEK